MRGVIDTHAHLAHRRFDRDRAAVLGKVWEAGVERMLEVGYDRSSSEAAVQLAKTDPRIRASVGIHPHEAGVTTEDDRQRVTALASDPVVRAIGEIGLDYYRNLSPRDRQMAEFRRQIGLARELHLPLVVHDRDAHEDVLAVLREERASEVGGVLHCFSGDGDLARAALDLGFRVGLGGTVTYPAPGKDEMLAGIPLGQIVLETDCPYLAPLPFRKERNDPTYLRLVVAHLVKIREEDEATLIHATSANARDLFRLDTT